MRQQQQQQYLQNSGVQPTQIQPGQFNGAVNLPRSSFKAAYVCGLLQIIFGAVCCVLGIAAIILNCMLYQSGAGIWCGVFFGISGIFGLMSLKKSNGMIIASMVLSIIAASLSGTVLFVLSIIAAIVEDQCIYQYYPDNEYICDYDSYKSRVAVDSLLVVVAVGEAVIAILQSVFCCVSYCSCCYESTTSRQTVMYFAVSNPEGIGQAYPMTVVHNPSDQALGSGSVQFVQQYANQQLGSTGYMYVVQPTAEGFQAPSNQSQSQATMHQQGYRSVQQQSPQQQPQPQVQQQQIQQPGYQLTGPSQQAGIVYHQPQDQSHPQAKAMRQHTHGVNDPSDSDGPSSPSTSSVKDDMSACLVENEVKHE